MFPGRVSDNACGRCYIATDALEPGTIVAQFEGPIVAYADVPEDEIRYVLGLDGNQWLIPQSSARYINHACAPNCLITDTLAVITRRKVKKEEELTITYNAVDSTAYRENPADYVWDPRWTFECKCGSEQCIGLVDGYIVPQSARRP